MNLKNQRKFTFRMCKRFVSVVALVMIIAGCRTTDLPYQTAVLEDVSPDISLQELLSDPQQFPFERKKADYSVGITNQAVWIKFEAIPDDGKKYFLSFQETPKNLTLFYFREGEGWIAEEAGRSVPISEREVLSHVGAFRVDNKISDKSAFYVRQQSASYLVLSHRIQSETEYVFYTNIENILWGCVIGISIFTSFFSLSVGLATKRSMYVYFALFCSGITVWNLLILGYAYYLIPALHDYSFLTIAIYFSITLIGASFVYFTREFVEFQRVSPAFDRLFRQLPLLFLLSFLIKAVSIDMAWSASLTAFVIFLTGCFAAYGIAIAIIKKSHAAIPLILACIPGVMIALLSISTIDIAPVNWISNNTVPLGGTFSILAFATALAGKMRVLQKQRDELQKQKYQHVQKVSEKLRELDRMKDVFFAKTSHELRTPLHGIIGLSEGILRQGVEKPVAGSLNTIIKCGKHLVSLVNDILDMAKLEHGTISVHPEPVVLQSVINSTLDVVSPLYGDRPVKLLREFGDNSPIVLCDEARISQVLYNLLGNALKFTNSGSVKISVVTISAEEVEVIISDTGPGISEEDMERIFLPFEQRITAPIDLSVGTGLGLYLTKQLLELQNSSLKVESKIGEGSHFSFRLPVVNQSEAFADQYQISSGFTGESLSIMTRHQTTSYPNRGEDMSDSTKLKIAIVDDDTVNRDVVAQMLDPRKHQAVTFASGSLFLQALESGEVFDLILLDIMMPNMDGYEVADSVRQRWGEEQIPIIFLSAKGQVDDIRSAFESGGSDYLVKPFGTDELLIRMEHQIRIKSSSSLFRGLFLLSSQIQRTKTVDKIAQILAEHLNETFDYEGVLAISEEEILSTHKDNNRSYFPLEASDEKRLISFINNLEVSTFLDGETHPDFSAFSDQISNLGNDAKLLYWKSSPSLAILLLGRNIRYNDTVQNSYLKSLHDQIDDFFSVRRDIVTDETLHQSISAVEPYLDRLLFIQSDPPYSRLYFSSGRDKLQEVRTSLSLLNTYYGETVLTRIHRSYLINPTRVIGIRRLERDHHVLLRDEDGQDITLPISRSRLKPLKRLFPEWFNEML